MDSTQTAVQPKQLDYQQMKFWCEEIDSCQKRQDEELRKRLYYPALLKYYEGDMYPPEKDHKNKTARLAMINEYFPNVNQLINELVYQYPEWTANPTKPEAEKEAPTMQGAISYAMKHLDSLTEVRLATFYMIMAGYGPVQIAHIKTKGFDTMFPSAEGENQQPGLLEKARNFVTSAFGIDQAEKELESELPPQEEAYSTQDETYCRCIKPENVLLDYQAERLKDMRYIIVKIPMTVARFEALYPEFEGKVQGESDIEYTEHKAYKHKSRVTLYHIQIIKKNKQVENYIICKNYKMSEIDYWVRPYVTNGFDVKIGILHEYGELYPVSYAKINKAVQDDLNNYLTFMMEVAERNIPKRGLTRSEDKTDTLAALNSNVINEVVKLSKPSDCWQIPSTNLSVENKELLAILQEIKEKLWTVSKQRLGGKGNEDFATELQIQESGFQTSISGVQLGIKKLWLSIADSGKDIIVQFWTDQYWFKITGAGQPSWYRPVVAPDGTVLNPLTKILTADYEIDLDISTSMRPNKDAQLAKLIKLAEFAMSPNNMMALTSQGQRIDAVSFNKKIFTMAGMNADTLIIPVQPMPGIMPGGMPPVQPGMPGIQPGVNQNANIPVPLPNVPA